MLAPLQWPEMGKQDGYYYLTLSTTENQNVPKGEFHQINLNYKLNITGFLFDFTLHLPTYFTADGSNLPF